MTENKVYKTAAYLRLSKGDEDVDGIEKQESNSISNQRLLIEKFIEQHPEMELVDTYIDDGYTGTDFKRPEMKRMMYDIDDGRIDCVVVKDLSRFGRERIQTGNYIQKVFVQKGVRFIAINDNYDSLTADGSTTHLIMPIKALTNDNFSRDISMKVRASFSIKRERGDYIASHAPYGYKKDPENVNHLIIDEPAAKIVRKIFAWKIEGMSSNEIARKLTEAGVLSPSDYRNSKKKNGSGSRNTRRIKWHTKQVIRILSSEILTGTMVQGKSTSVSYKVHKLIQKPREEWDIVKGTHEPIVSKADFDIVQTLLSRDTIVAHDPCKRNIYAGLLFCADCGSAMIRRKAPAQDGERWDYICSGHNNGTGCGRHQISEETVTEAVLVSVNQMIGELCRYDELARNLENMHVHLEDAMNRDKEIAALKEELTKYNRLKSALYQDLKEGMINEDQFDRYRNQYTEREISLQNAIKNQKALIEEIYQNGIVADSILQQFRENPKVDKLNRRLLVSLIDRILVYDDRRIEIIYRYSAEMKKCKDILQAGAETDGQDK